MARTNDQTFEVTITCTITNLGDTVSESDVTEALVKALDTLPLELDYSDSDISVSEEG